MKKQLMRAAATTVLGLSLTTGFAAAATGDISNTGASSENKVYSKVHNRVSVHNDNNVTASNSNSQTATTGEAESEENTTGGDATSGDASNDNSLDATVDINNSGSGNWWGGLGSGGDNSGTIDTTGYNSYNVVKAEVKNSVYVRNTNNLTVTNTNSQTATSGDASVEENTDGGSATSGNASNTNSTTLNLSVTN